MALLCCFNTVSDVPGSGGSGRSSGKRHRCTDATFLGIFIVFWLGLIFVGTYAWLVGNPLRMIHGSDSFGNVCGHTNTPVDKLQFAGLDLRHRPYLFHLNQADPRNSIKICVHSCPRQTLSNLAEVYNFYTQTNSSLCRYDFDFSTSAAVVGPGGTGAPQTQPYIQDRRPVDYSQGSFPSRVVQNNSYMSESGVCPSLPVYPTRPLLYHCVPEVAITQGIALGHSVYDFISSYVPLNKIFSDIVNAHEEMTIMAGVALGSAILSAFVIHYVAHLASWLILLSISVLLIVLTSILWWTYIDSRYRLETMGLPEDYANESILLAVAIIATLFTIVILYAASTLRSHVRFVVALFGETSACLRAMPMLLAQPIWTLFSLLFMLFGWLLLMMALSTASHQHRESRFLKPPQQHAQSMVNSAFRSAFDQSPGDRSSVVNNAGFGQSFTLINYDRGDLSWIHYMWWYLVVAFIWLSEFILSCQQMVIAGAVANWYFCRNRDRLERPIGRAFRQLICCHLGSVALGSFLITLFKLPRLIIQQITSRLRQYDNRLAKTTLEACSCCLWMVERFLAYLSRNAYTVVVIEKTDFCPSARIAFQAMITNALKVAAINSIGDFILFLGKLSVAAITALVGVFLVRANPSLHYWMAPVLLMTLIAFWIAHCLLSVYEMVIDAMFLCFCQDMNRNDGSPGSEYYAPESLMRFLSDDEPDASGAGQHAMAEVRSNDSKTHGSESDYATVP